MAREQSLFWSQSRGLLARSWHYQRRQTCANVSNFLVPPLLLLVLYGLNQALQPKTEKVLPFQRTPQGAYAALPFEADQCLDLARELGPAEAEKACTADPFQNKVTIPFFAPTGTEAVLGGKDAAAGTASGVLGGLSLSPFIYPDSLPGSNSNFSKEQTWYDGVFLNKYGAMDRNSPLYSAFVAAAQPGSLDNAYKTKTRRVGDKATFLSLIFDSWFTGGAFTPYKTAYGFSKVSGSKAANLSADVTVYYNESELVDANCTKSCQVFSAVQRLDAAVFATASPGNTAAAYLRRMPDTGYQEGVNFIGLVISIVLALLLHFFLPFFTGFLVYERQSRLRELMSSSGLRPTTYWFSTYIALLLQYAVMACLVTAIGIGLSIPFFDLNEFLTYAILFFVWGNVLIALAIFFAPFFSSAETATVMVWLFVILVNFVGGPFVGRISSVEDRTSEGYWSAVMLLPSFSLMRSVYHAGAFNSGGQGIVVASDQFYQGTNLGMCSGNGPVCRSMIFLVVEWIVLMVIGLYLDQVLPSAAGVRKHPLFFLGLKRGRGRGDALLTRAIDENELEEVAVERNLVSEIVANDPQASEGIVIDSLHKIYGAAKPPVHAVRGLSFVARHGEITGLLGSNGSGKTSAIRCLIGAHDVSGGDAYIYGHSIRTEMPEIHRSMGICLQQDIQWESLSIREHLFFFGRLRNIPKNELKEAVERAMASVGLTYAAHRKSEECSGGMRRRLSVAMALLGDPSTIILDELSSGLDPSNAAVVWRAIREAKAGKTILLTTHSMEEAQVLCDRLHMVTRGALRTTGNPEELRLRLGRGYRLAAAVPESMVGDFHGVMMGISPECRIETSLGGSLQYSIPKNVLLSTIFDTMAANKGRLRMHDWGVSQSSLEDVFLNIVARDEAEVGVTKLKPSSDNA